MRQIRVVRFRLNADRRGLDRVIADDMVPGLKQQPGCSGAYFASNGDGECALVVLWDSSEQADAAAQTFSPKLMGHLNGNTIAPPDIHLLPLLSE
jgi:hypothetical protein